MVTESTRPFTRAWWRLTAMAAAGIAMGLLIALGFVNSVLSSGRPPGITIGYDSQHQTLASGETDSADLSELKTAATIDFDNTRAMLRLLEASRRSRYYEGQATALKALVQLDPGAAALHAELAGALLNMGEFKEATTHAAVATRIEPDQPRNHLIYGASLLAADDKQEAAIAYRKALALDPNSEVAKEALKFPLAGY